MVKLTVLYGQPADAAAFEQYYAETHTPIALRMQGVRRFEVAKVIGAPDGSPTPYYRSADLYFDDMQHFQSVLGSPEGRATAADLPNFASGGVQLVLAEVQDLMSK